VWHRWTHAENWQLVKQEFFKTVPSLLQYVVPYVANVMTTRTLYSAGIGKTFRRIELTLLGRFTPQEIEEIYVKDMKSVADFLGNKQFFLGDTPSTIDATVYGTRSTLTVITLCSIRRK
jgi:hypothetical protein